MKRVKVLQMVSFLLITVMMLSACGSKSSYDTATSNVNYGSSSSKPEAADSSGSDGALYSTNEAVPQKDSGESTVSYDSDMTDTNETKGISNSTAITNEELQSGSTQNKIIKNYYLDVETQDFDNLIKNINNQIKSLGGYVESSSIGGNSYYDSNVTRSGNIVARISGEKSDEFVNTIDEAANVTNNQSSTENVTLKYVDTQSRIEALKTEQERLFAILEKADDLDSIITLESRLGDIRYELSNYESQLRVYDNEVQYSTVNLNIQEVDRITPETKVKPTFTSRIQNGFSDTLYNISEGFKNFTVWFIVNLPYLLIWGIIIFLIVLITRRYIRKTKQRKPLSAPPLSNGQNNGVHSYSPLDQLNSNEQQDNNQQNK